MYLEIITSRCWDPNLSYMTSVDNFTSSSWDSSDKPANLGRMTGGLYYPRSTKKIYPQILAEQNAASGDYTSHYLDVPNMPKIISCAISKKTA